MSITNQNDYKEFLKNNTALTITDGKCTIKFKENLSLNINDKEFSIYKIKCAEDNNIIVCNKLDNYTCDLVNLKKMPKEFIESLCEVYPEVCK